MRKLFALCLIVGIAGCAGTAKTPVPAARGGIPDTEIGLSKAGVLDVPVPDAVPVNDATPGDRSPLPRPHAEMPPVVPHGVGDFVPITRDENLCLDCHGAAEPGDDATPLPASHYVDLRNAPSEAGDEVAGARYACMSCHVVDRDASPLVTNRFAAPR